MTSSSRTNAAPRSPKKGKFAYYRRLSPLQKRIYQRSESVDSIPIPSTASFGARLLSLKESLLLGDRRQTEDVSQALMTDLSRLLNVLPPKVCILEERPVDQRGELHGLYERRPDWSHPRITVWMRTARREAVVAPKTFLRTLLHELTHHLDYTWLRLPRSFHTLGFYRRESSLVRQLLA